VEDMSVVFRSMSALLDSGNLKTLDSPIGTSIDLLRSE
jgi:hypothetical protein